MASDIKRKRIVLFAGSGLANQPGGSLGDTWEWDGDQWTQHEGQIGPPARERHSSAYDILRERTVLFGGIDSRSASLGDTWEWDGSTWLQVAQFGPDARSLHQIVFDGNVVMLFGGIVAGDKGNGETWEWDGKRWTIRRVFGPLPRLLHTMAFDASRGRVVLFGGSSNIQGNADFNDTWEPFDREPIPPPA